MQRGVRHGDRAERRDQEALQTFSERDAREEGLQGVQADEAGQSQKRKFRGNESRSHVCNRYIISIIVIYI